MSIDRAELNTAIDEFLAKRSLSDSGYAPVAEGDVDSLSKIISMLIELKFEADADGDYPLVFDVTDRTRYEKPLYVAAPRVGWREGEDTIGQALDALRAHSTMARYHTEKIAHINENMTYQMSGAALWQKPLNLFGQNFRPQPPAGVSSTDVIERFRELALASFHARKALREAASGVHVNLSALSEVQESIRVSMNIALSVGSVRQSGDGGARVILDIPVLSACVKVFFTADELA